MMKVKVTVNGHKTELTYGINQGLALISSDITKRLHDFYYHMASVYNYSGIYEIDCPQWLESLAKPIPKDTE